MPIQKEFDLIIIGSGPGGYKAAVLAGLRGLSTAIIEKHTWGGCCLNRGCVPKKTWYHTAQLVQASGGFKNRGITGELKADLDQAWNHQQAVVKTIRDSYVNYLKRLGISHYEGHGKLIDSSTVDCLQNEQTIRLKAKHIILATGSSAYIPDNIQLVPGKILSTDMLFDQEVPAGQSIAIMGGGVIGTEFAFILSQFNKEIHWFLGRQPIQRSDFTPQAREVLNSTLKEIPNLSWHQQRPDKIQVVGDKVIITSQGKTIEVDWLLLGTGRKPHTDNLGLENTSVACDNNGFIKRNEYLQTQESNIYAIGDCTSPEMTANQALADAHIAISNIIEGNHKKQNPIWTPQAIYSAVEMARIGMNEDMAEDAGHEPAVGFSSFESSPRALGQDDTNGFVRLIADMDSGELLGGEIIGNNAGELIHMLSSTQNREEALSKIANTAFNHPSRTEELLNATETLASKWGLSEHIFGDNSQ